MCIHEKLGGNTETSSGKQKNASNGKLNEIEWQKQIFAFRHAVSKKTKSQNKTSKCKCKDKHKKQKQKSKNPKTKTKPKESKNMPSTKVNTALWIFMCQSKNYDKEGEANMPK